MACMLVDDVADISNEEQMLAFVQYFDVELGTLQCKFLQPMFLKRPLVLMQQRYMVSSLTISTS